MCTDEQFHADEIRCRNRRLDLLDPDHPGAVESNGLDRQSRRLRSLEDRGVIAGGGQDRVNAKRPRAHNWLGDRLGGGPGEYHLAALGTGKRRHARPCGLYQVALGAAVAVYIGGIADLVERGDLRRARLRKQRGGSIVIEIYRRSRHHILSGRRSAARSLKHFLKTGAYILYKERSSGVRGRSISHVPPNQPQQAVQSNGHREKLV